MFQMRSQLDVDVLLGGKALATPPAPAASIARERVRVEVALVEQLLGRLDDRGDDAGLADDAARRADGAAARLRCDPRMSSASLAAPASASRRWSIGVEPAWAAWPRQVIARALDAERAEDDAERQVHRLEHRPLLDVQLEVGARALELRPRVERAVEVDAVRARARRAARPRRDRSASRSSSWSRIEPPAADEPKSERPKRAPSSSAQLTSRTGTGGVPSLGDPAQDLDARQHVQAAVEPAAVRDRVDVAADQQRVLATIAIRTYEAT